MISALLCLGCGCSFDNLGLLLTRKTRLANAVEILKCLFYCIKNGAARLQKQQALLLTSLNKDARKSC